MGDGYEISIKRLAKQKAEGKYPSGLSDMKPKDRSFDPSGQITSDEPTVTEDTPKSRAMKQIMDMVNDIKKVPYDDPQEEEVAQDPMADADKRSRKKRVM